jgi:predicted phosphate transport protein (TIGR00153 family)
MFEKLRKKEVSSMDKEERVLAMIRVYINEIIEVVEKLTPLINAFCVEDAVAAQREFQHLLKLEKEADGTRKGILLELSRGGNYPVSKEDLLQLIKSLAALGTIAAGIGCRIMMRTYSLPTQMKEHLLKMLANDLELILKLREALMAMRPSMRKAIELSHAVEEIEEKADEIYRVLYSDLFTMDIDFKSFYQLRDIITGLENLADSAKECAEIVRLIAVKYV